MKHDQKQKLIRDLEQNFDRADTAYLLDYTRMTVAQSVALRKLLRKNDYTLKVVKNRLALRALKADFPEALTAISRTRRPSPSGPTSRSGWPSSSGISPSRTRSWPSKAA